MSFVLGKTSDEEWFEKLEAAEAAAEAARVAANERELNTRRGDLLLLLEERFGAISDTLRARVEATTDPEQLRHALRQVLRIQTPDELPL